MLVPYTGKPAGQAVMCAQCMAEPALACLPRCTRATWEHWLRIISPHPCPNHTGVRMVEDEPSIVPFSDAYDTHCARYGRETDAPILAFKARCCTPEGMTADGKARLEAYQEVVEKGVTENIFSQFMYKTMVENNLSMWTTKKQFALSAAMSGEAGGQGP